MWFSIICPKPWCLAQSESCAATFRVIASVQRTEYCLHVMQAGWFCGLLTFSSAGSRPMAKWTGNPVNYLPGREEVVHKLKELKEALCWLDGWIDHGTQVLLVAQPSPVQVCPS